MKNLLQKKSIFLLEVLLWPIAALILTIIIESISKGSFNSTITFMIEKNRVFMVNYLIILTITSISLLFKRLFFAFSAISFVGIVLAFANLIIVRFRSTPFTWNDLYSIKDGIAIAEQYFNYKLVILIVTLTIFIIAFLSFLWKFKIGMTQIKRVVSIVIVFIVTIFTMFTIDYCEEKKIINILQWDIITTYSQNGFIYSFTHSIKASYTEKPQGYSQNSISKLGKDLEFISSIEEEEKPNIIMIQLESFIDPYILRNIEFSEDPIRNFRAIWDENGNPMITVPAVGGGTARTEFEVLTAMSLEYLPPGIIPHNTIIKRKALESIGYILKELEYTTTVVHNYQANFYDRNIAFANLGFDRFISMEYMENLNREGREFPKDDVLFESIKENLVSTDTKDLIYGITAQTHGDYPSIYSNEDSIIKVSGKYEKEYINQLQKYIDDLYEVDILIGEFKEWVSNLDEPTIVVMFSDHIPNIGLYSNGELGAWPNEYVYNVPYIVFDNMNLPKSYDDIRAYKMYPMILNKIGINNGILNKYHNEQKNSDSYQLNLELLQYDMIFGKNYIYNGDYPYNSTKIQLGTEKSILINDTWTTGNNRVISGSGFTKYSKIYIDGKSIDTEYIDSSTLKCIYDKEDIDYIEVKQIGRYNNILSSTERFSIEAIKPKILESWMTGSYMTVNGEGFNENSKIFIDNNEIYTEFIDENYIKCLVPTLNFDYITVKNLNDNGVAISETDKYLYYQIEKE